VGKRLVYILILEYLFVSHEGVVVRDMCIFFQHGIVVCV
jgi:hypothetical protein